jgi:hypothetical protein
MFRFSNLAYGTYYVRQVLSKGERPTGAAPRLTLAAGQTVRNLTLGSRR